MKLFVVETHGQEGRLFHGICTSLTAARAAAERWFIHYGVKRPLAWPSLKEIELSMEQNRVYFFKSDDEDTDCLPYILIRRTNHYYPMG